MVLVKESASDLKRTCFIYDSATDAVTKEEMVEEHKATSRKSIQWWDSNFQVDPDSLFAPGYINYQIPVAATDGEKGVTLDELKTIVASYHSAFPGTKVEFLMQVAEGNRVATHWTFSAVHKGTYEGLAPTGKSVTWAGTSIDEYDAGGKITRSWVVWDKYTMFRELGLIN
jgi:predicted ester cyclase